MQKVIGTPSTPSPSVRASVSPLARPRTRTPTVAPSPSPTLRVPPTPTLRTQKSAQNLRTKTPTPAKSPVRKTRPLPPEEDVPPTPSRPQLSIREQIALKRAEVKKIVKSPVVGEFEGLETASPHAYNQPVEHDVDLGRWSIKETIERARSSGAINLCSRDLPCIPSALFEIHLGITPEPLKSAPVEPPIGSSDTRRKGNQNGPSWYDAQDLEVLKAWSNEIQEIQPEISMFGSLKTVDLHNNKLQTLPDTFADLTALTSIDLSHNQLTSLPVNFWALPHLTTLNLSHNALTSLPFSAPFGSGSTPLGRTKDSRGDWFTQSITRATEPLPRLMTLDVSHNHLAAASIDHSTDGPGLPALLSKLDLSGNPLGKCDSLFRALGRLERLREIHMLKADIGDDSFPVSVFASTSGSLFPLLKILDMEETQVTRPVVEAVFTPNVIKQMVQFDITSQEPPDGVLRIIVGKRVVKEAWEIEAERRTKQRRGVAFPESSGSSAGRSDTKSPVQKESWEIEAEEGLLSEGAKRRMRAQAAAAQSSAPSTSTTPPPGAKSTPSSPQKKTVVVEKEPWEIEAEQGLLSAGARRRARAAALLAASEATQADAARTPSPSTPSPASSHTPPSVGAALANPQYYDAASRTLTLPPSAPPSKSSHARSFSLAAPAWSKSKGPATTGVPELTLAIPAPTLPLAAIAAQPLAHNLKVLILTNRRADPSFSIPTNPGICLPYLEELSLENCNLGDTVPVAHVGEAGGDEFAPQRTNEPLLPLLAKLFPSVRTLDLSYNALTSAALTKAALASLIFAEDTPTPGGDGEDTATSTTAVRKGLRQLRLRGNRLNGLDGFQELAERFRGNRDVPEWKLEELDLRDNEIGKLPAELGLLPLEVFLVDGNTFRVPQRRVWEREGTKGLLSWLRGRIE
ncbi:hypothetical protein L227DRAFT_596442 [Lentinus tigrinus ALCF2SS1-6]|uniref:L domain-like protein n=1 Tax=Lentinus tigrinus ALCF2SS1-6 TaxID=1328759 RepID=A0A5C2RQB7_9APHY|nr:hypothetical protein L227DRAFT_596442 [Lentinus tigrinus ALCF2SS1-6]